MEIVLPIKGGDGFPRVGEGSLEGVHGDLFWRDEEGGSLYGLAVCGEEDGEGAALPKAGEVLFRETLAAYGEEDLAKALRDACIVQAGKEEGVYLFPSGIRTARERTGKERRKDGGNGEFRTGICLFFLRVPL